jgi:hypothetical protein
VTLTAKELAQIEQATQTRMIDDIGEARTSSSSSAHTPQSSQLQPQPQPQYFAGNIKNIIIPNTGLKRQDDKYKDYDLEVVEL